MGAEKKEVLSTDDVMEIFGVTRMTLYVWRTKGDFPQPMKIGGKLFWRRLQIETYMDAKLKERE